MLQTVAWEIYVGCDEKLPTRTEHWLKLSNEITIAEFATALARVLDVGTDSTGSNWYVGRRDSLVDVDVKEASLHHRINHYVKLNNGSTKHTADLTDKELENVAGSVDSKSASEAAKTEPGWDEDKEKPSQGFYRATQTWHPETGPAGLVPGEISALELAPPIDLVIEAPEQVSGVPGEIVNLK